MVVDLQYADTVTLKQEFVEINPKSHLGEGFGLIISYISCQYFVPTLIITKIELTEIEDLFYIFGLLGNNF